MMLYATKFIAMLISLVQFFAPFHSFAALEEEMLLNVSVISDVHIDTRLPLGKYILQQGFIDMNNCANPLDAVIVCGDLTNYGDEASLLDFFNIMNTNCYAPLKVIAMGNHDIGHVRDLGYTNQQARDWFLKDHNMYLGTDFTKNYYSYDYKGYKFIVLCDESEDNWDEFEIYDEQIQWLDNELKEGTKSGKPTFVVVHEPLEETNGQETVWKNGAMNTESSNKIKAVLSKYENKNVFFVTGHVHEGINNNITKDLFDVSSVETKNGITYVNLPTYLLVNRYGLPENGLGFQFEVYESKVHIRTRSFLTGKWIPDFEWEIPVV